MHVHAFTGVVGFESTNGDLEPLAPTDGAFWTAPQDFLGPVGPAGLVNCCSGTGLASYKEMT